MKFPLTLLLFSSLFVTEARAQNYESKWVSQEKDFQNIQKKKAEQEKLKYDGLEAFLKKKDRDAAKKQEDLHHWLELKLGNRSPAVSLEDEDNTKREAWRKKNAEFQRRYVQSVVESEKARQKVLKDFDSEEVRSREAKPWH